MRTTTRALLVTGTVLAGLCFAGCDGCGKKAGEVTPGVSPSAVRAPKEVMAYVALKEPKRTLDEGLALIKQFVPQLPYNRQMVLGIFAQQLKLPSDMLDAFDITRPFWLVALDREQMENVDAFVFAIPVTSEEKFSEALRQKMQKAGREGDLALYKPKPGQTHLKEMLLKIVDRYVFVPSSRLAMEKTDAYLKGALLTSKPEHDLELHVLMDNVLAAKGEELDRSVEKTVGKIRRDVTAQAGAVDQKPMVEATESTIKRYVDLLKSTRRLTIGADLKEDGLALSVVGEAEAKGPLQELIKNQRAGAPVGLERLPAASWLVFSDHGNPEAIKAQTKVWRPMLSELLKGLNVAGKDQLVEALASLVDHFSGDSTLAVHKAPSGAGVTVSMVGTVTEGAKAQEKLSKLVAQVGDLIKATMEQQGQKLPEGFALQQRPFEHKGAKGMILGFRLADQPSIPDDQKQKLTALLGDEVSLGWAFTDKMLFVAALKDAERQLRQLVEGKPEGTGAASLAANPSFINATKAGPNRVGVFYLSTVTGLLSLDGSGILELAPLIAGLRGKQVQKSPTLDWGFDDSRTRMDISLRLPTEELLLLLPAVMSMQQPGLGRVPLP